MKLAHAHVHQKIEPALKDTQRVLAAIRSGCQTRSDIKKATDLSWDRTTDALAILNCEQGVIRFTRLDDEPHFYVVKVA